jgi:hypothetical protein
MPIDALLLGCRINFVIHHFLILNMFEVIKFFDKKLHIGCEKAQHYLINRFCRIELGSTLNFKIAFPRSVALPAIGPPTIYIHTPNLIVLDIKGLC